MASQTPFARLVGPLKIYIAPSTEAPPNLDAAVAGNWVELGTTDGEQTIKQSGSLERFSDNEANAMRKSVRPEDGWELTAALVNITLEDRAYINSRLAAAVTTTTSGALTVKRLANARGYIPERFSLLLRGGAITGTNTESPYLSGPAQHYVPLGVFDGEPEEVRSKDGSPALEFNYKAEWDAAQAAGDELGWMLAQSA